MSSPFGGDSGVDLGPAGGVDLSFPSDPGPAAPELSESAVPVPANGSRASAPSTDLSHLGIVAVDADENVRTQLAAQLGAHAVPVASVAGAAEGLDGRPVVIVLGPSCATGAELAVIEQLTAGRPELAAVLVASELTTTLLQQALRAGVKDVLALPVDAGQLSMTVKRVGEALLPTAVPAVPGEVLPITDPEELGQVVTVFSTKGGAGKSVIACNVAVRLAKRSGRPVALVDADLQFGDVAVMLKLAPQHTIVDAVGSIDRMDAGLLDNLLVTHEPSGLKVLPAPLEPAFADQVTGEEMVRIVELLRTFCSHVVIDTPAYFNDVVLGLIEVSDDVLLVAGMDIPNIKNVKIGLQTLRLLDTPMSKLRLVLNRANSKVKLDVSEVEKTLQVKADALIPSDVVVPQSVNKGTPVVLAAPKSAVTRALEQLADTFLTADRRR
jgi:pilus assembly protein CpaE